MSKSFDLEGHRGTRGLRPENTLAAFGKALHLGVATLELDTGLTRDGVVVVSHEGRLSSLECRDTTPAFPGDPQFPYVGRTDKLSDGKLIKELTLAQIKTLDCGTRHPLADAVPTDPFVGTQQSVPGTKMPTLAEVFELARRSKADDVQFDIETKLDPTLPGDTVDPDMFARAVIGVIDHYGMRERSMLQSFYWRTLKLARGIAPDLRRVALRPEHDHLSRHSVDRWPKGKVFEAVRWGAGRARAEDRRGHPVDQLSRRH
jgi:glycerophosphoryl diester phosphodiesterase